MMQAIFSRARLTVGLALILSVLGAVAWFAMPRQEDPEMQRRFALVVTPYPGADALTVERLVAEPLERELAEVEQIKDVITTIRSGVVVTQINLRDDVGDYDRAWSDVQDALDDARTEFPDEALPPRLDDRLNQTESVVVALTGPADVLALRDAAKTLERALAAEGDVSRVVVTADPEEQITVVWGDGLARQLGLPAAGVAQMLQGRNVTAPAGSVTIDGRAVDVRPAADFRSIEEIRETPLLLPGGAGARLGDLTEVRRTAQDPARVMARHNGRPAVLVGVIPRAGIDVVGFGERMLEVLGRFEETHPSIEVERIAFQPGKVEQRLSELSRSLLQGIGIVAVVLVLTMGLRLGLVVALVVPLVTFASVGLYAAGGGVLHQITVAAVVLALGLLVDNAIVVAEAIQRRLDEGETRKAAVQGALRELALPLASATVTTVAAFVPMALSEGPSADFTRAIPIMVMLTLGASYVYALVVTPAMAGLALKPKPRTTKGWFDRLTPYVARFSVRRPWLVLVLTAGIFAAEGWAASNVGFSFFPSSDREQMTVMVEMPEGTHLRRTDEVARKLEAELATRDDVQAVTTVVGRGGPTFYYNLRRLPSSPHLAQLIVTADDSDAVGAIIEQVRARAKADFPEARILPRRLEQGPPLAAPVEVRLYGTDLAELHDTATEVRALLRGVEGAEDVRSNEGLGIAVLGVDIDDAHAGRHGIDRARISGSLYGQTSGIPAGVYRGGEDPTPIVVRGGDGEDTSLTRLRGIDVPGKRGPVPLLEVADTRIEMAPAVLHHRNGRRVVAVLAEVEAGSTYAAVVKALEPQLQALDLGDVQWEFGGAAESSKRANKAVGDKAPFGVLLLVAVLLAEFNSFRRVAIILATAPLAAMGIWPGLMLAELAFGFVAMLGAIALIGIVVNGAIVLIDVADRKRAEGASVSDALQAAVELRTRPILLTTATTIAGLLPLGFSSSTLWPPMAWAMVSGLLIATVLSLFVVPSLYRILIRDPKSVAAPEEASR